ncbi:MAG: aminoacyl-tRNA hydrolase [Chloroflexi bacterium]|nr:aminoacyl-tRNA hydrolase [Chloroflexota bacterium]MBI3734526.1 aminoacyl-tRNA hydrolase [Chloroflexota bacterium]
MDDLLLILPGLAIPRSELQYRFTRSGGPGGQHVNRTSTQVELLWDAARSPSLTAEQLARLLHVLKNRIDGDGVLHLVSHSTRSQFDNREDVTARFVALLAAALKPVKKRRPTRPTRAAKERRITAKKARGEVKKKRRLTAQEME